MDYIVIPLNALMRLCYQWTGNYTIAIILFTILTKIILFPVSMWTQRNSIKMVEIMPAINELKLKYYGDKETIAEEQQKLYKKVGYHPLVSSIPLIIQIVLLMGVIAAVKSMIGGDESSIYARIPSQVGGVSLLMPVAAGLASLCLGLTQNRIGPLQREQERKEQIATNAVSVAISLFLGAFVSIGTCVYWIASNLLSIPNQLLLNIAVNPKKYIDYEALNKSRSTLRDYNALSSGVSKEDKRRERADYKRFFSIENKHLVFYSEKSGFYKYFKNTIEYLLAHSNIVIHYVTNDPRDQIFQIAEEQPRLKAYYIGKEKMITLFMKMDADMVVMTTPDLDNYYLKRSYVKKDIEYVYMPHGLGSTTMTTHKGAYDHFDTVLCTGQHQIDELRETEQMYHLPAKNLIPGGYAVLDQLLASYDAKSEEINVRPRILIAPSWQEDNILDSCLDEILAELLKKDYEIIVRPHPEYIKRYGPRMDAILTRYQGISKEKLSFEMDFGSNFNIFSSDVLITDWSGICYEFSFCTKKPTLFINTKMKIYNPDYDKYSKPCMDVASRDIIGVSIDPKEAEKIGDVVSNMLDHREMYSERINAFMQDDLFCVGKNGEAAGRYILRRLTEKKSGGGEK